MSHDDQGELQSNVSGERLESPKASERTSTEQFRVMSVTMSLRWSATGKLQQLWRDTYSGYSEWQDVPTEGNK